MKIYGYTFNGEKEHELSEASVLCSLDEIDKIIEFFKYARKHFSNEEYLDEPGHIHYRDWNEKWKNSTSDLIIVYKVPDN